MTKKEKKKMQSRYHFLMRYIEKLKPYGKAWDRATDEMLEIQRKLLQK